MGRYDKVIESIKKDLENTNTVLRHKKWFREKFYKNKKIKSYEELLKKHESFAKQAEQAIKLLTEHNREER